MKSKAIWIARDTANGYLVSDTKMMILESGNFYGCSFNWGAEKVGITLKIGEQVRVKLVKVGVGK